MSADPQNSALHHDSWLLNCVYNLMLGRQPYVLALPPSPISPTVRLYGRLERSVTNDVLDHMVQGLHLQSESYGTISIGHYTAPVEEFCRDVITAMTPVARRKPGLEEETAALKQAMAEAMGAPSFQHLENSLERGKIVQHLHPYLKEMYAWVDKKIADAQHELNVYGSGNENKREGYGGDLRVWPRMRDVMRKLEPVINNAIYNGVLDEEAIDHALAIADSHLPELRKEINDWWPLATALQIGLVESVLEASIKKDASANREATQILHDTATSWHFYLEQAHVDYWPANTRVAELALQQPGKSKAGDKDFLAFADCLHAVAEAYQAAKTYQFPDKPVQELRAIYRNKNFGKPALVM